MRAFGILGNNPLNKWGQGGVLLPGLLVLHALLATIVIGWGRAGFEIAMALPGARAAMAILALIAIAGLWHAFVNALGLEQRLAVGIASVFPLTTLAALIANVDYDVLSATFSATWFGEADAFWLPGVPFVAIGFSFALLAYTWTCEVCVSKVWGVRGRRLRGWALWSLSVVSFAGVVHWATGW